MNFDDHIPGARHDQPQGPPFYIGDYVVTTVYRVWRVYPRAVFTQDATLNDSFVLETPRKRAALKHARQLERERLRILRAADGDPVALAQVVHEAKRDWQREQREREETEFIERFVERYKD